MARPRLSQDTRERLLTEGVSAFLRNGFHGTGLQAVLDQASVPKGSFYNYFASKEEFAAVAVRHYGQCLATQQEAAMAGQGDPLKGLYAFFEALKAAFEQAGFTGGCLVANLGAELEGSDLCRDALQEVQLAWRLSLREAIESAQAAGLLRLDLLASAMADLLVDSWEGAVIRMKIERSSAPLDNCLQSLLGGYFLP